MRKIWSKFNQNNVCQCIGILCIWGVGLAAGVQACAADWIEVPFGMSPQQSYVLWIDSESVEVHPDDRDRRDFVLLDQPTSEAIDAGRLPEHSAMIRSTIWCGSRLMMMTQRTLFAARFAQGGVQDRDRIDIVRPLYEDNEAEQFVYEIVCQ